MNQIEWVKIHIKIWLDLAIQIEHTSSGVAEYSSPRTSSVAGLTQVILVPF